MKIEEAIGKAPATPAGRQAGWMLARIHRRGEGASAEDWARYVPALAETVGRGGEAEEGWRSLAERLGAIRAVAFASTSDVEIEAAVETGVDRRWKLTVAVEEAAPHRITRLEWQRLRDFSLEVREATDADAAILADLERRAPIVREGTKIWFDRGEAWFDFSRLMEEHTVGIAFVDGEAAAVTCGARHTVRIGGADKSIVTVSHLRVAPEHQRKGLWGEVNTVLGKYWPKVDGSNAYIAVDNAAMQHGFRSTPNKWPGPLLWARLDTAALAGPACGRRATAADAGAVAALINAFREGEEMYVPWTAESLARRMARASELYSWERLWLAPGAVVGVWPAGRALRLVTERDGTRSVSEPGVVLDYGFAPGAEGAFEDLVRAWCGWLAERGMDRLSIFTSPASRGAALIGSLAGELEAFDMWTPGIAVPADAADKGLYLDPVYF
ncbi:MAG TPA: hypothetical protein VII63_12565 [Caulobacteraceae bacterium]